MTTLTMDTKIIRNDRRVAIPKTVRDVLTFAADYFMFAYDDQSLVAMRIFPKPLYVGFTVHTGADDTVRLNYKRGDQYRIDRYTTVGGTLWGAVKGKGVKRAALEAWDGSVQTHRDLTVITPDFTLVFKSSYGMGINDDEPSMLNDACDDGDCEKSIEAFSGDLAAALAWFGIEYAMPVMEAA